MTSPLSSHGSACRGSTELGKYVDSRQKCVVQSALEARLWAYAVGHTSCDVKNLILNEEARIYASVFPSEMNTRYCKEVETDFFIRMA